MLYTVIIGCTHVAEIGTGPQQFCVDAWRWNTMIPWPENGSATLNHCFQYSWTTVVPLQREAVVVPYLSVRTKLPMSHPDTHWTAVQRFYLHFSLLNAHEYNLKAQDTNPIYLCSSYGNYAYKVTSRTITYPSVKIIGIARNPFELKGHGGHIINMRNIKYFDNLHAKPPGTMNQSYIFQCVDCIDVLNS